MTERRRSEVPQTALGFGVSDRARAIGEELAESDAQTEALNRMNADESFAVDVGKPLPNGAMVMAAEPNGEYVVVLALRMDMSRGLEGAAYQYVTWKVDPDTGEAFWGDYMDDFDEAVRNYKERVGS